MIKIIKGETRSVKVTITAGDGSAFDIINPTYRFYGRYDNEVEDSGDCEQSGHVLTVTITPESAKTYTMEMTMQIAGETIIKRIEVAVS